MTQLKRGLFDMSEWIEWNGGECPVHNETIVTPVLRSGLTDIPQEAGNYRWNHLGWDSDIVRFRVKKSSETENKDDNVNTPSHYVSGNLECIDAIREMLTKEQFKGMLAGNVMKYIWRRDYKGKPLEDSLKAKWYLNRLIEEYENDE